MILCYICRGVLFENTGRYEEAFISYRFSFATPLVQLKGALLALCSSTSHFICRSKICSRDAVPFQKMSEHE
jgi:hypothetical protein